MPGEKVTDKVLGGYRHDFDATPIDTDGASQQPSRKDQIVCSRPFLDFPKS